MDLRRIDALVAEHVMGWTPKHYEGGELSAFIFGDGPSKPNTGKRWIVWRSSPALEASQMFNPSEDIAAAWEVLEAMSHWHPRLSYCDTTMVWSLEWTKPRRDDLPRSSLVTTVDEPGFDKLPLVICLAALKAKGIEVG